ncbi:hypothetical protein Aduo_002440 [Ancylostoma duodenale]
MISQCVRFEPNCFNKGKCKNCYKSKEQHSVDSLEKAKLRTQRLLLPVWAFVSLADEGFTLSAQWIAEGLPGISG